MDKHTDQMKNGTKAMQSEKSLTVEKPRRDFIRFSALGGFSSLLFSLNSLAATPEKALPPSSQKTPKMLIVGDSMSAEYGLQRGEGWVSLLQDKLKKSTEKSLQLWSVVNASISGDTTAGGRSRFQALITQNAPQLVLIELGGNDALRGLALQSTRANLVHMVQTAQRSGAQVMLIGMQVPPNYGKTYSQQFSQMFEEVAQAENALLVPFLLQAFAEKPNALEWFQSDRIHPNALAQPLMLETVWKNLLPSLLQFEF